MADEIRKLAFTTTESIKKIEHIVNMIQKDSTSNYQQLTQVKDVVTQVADTIAQVAGSVEQAGALSHQLSTIANKLSRD